MRRLKNFRIIKKNDAWHRFSDILEGMKKYIKGKTWIDWIKVIVAIDIAAVGVGLIFQESIHILANLLGPFSRILFGILYLMVAVAIVKVVFVELFEDLKYKEKKIDDVEDEEDVSEEKETFGEVIDNTAKKIDDFVQGRAQEVKEEVKKVLDEE